MKKSIYEVPCSQSPIRLLLNEEFPARVFISEKCYEYFMETSQEFENELKFSVPYKGTLVALELSRLDLKQILAIKNDCYVITGKVLMYDGVLFELLSMHGEGLDFEKKSALLESYTILRRECEKSTF